MEWFENVTSNYSQSCGCDEHCGADTWGCDNDNEGTCSSDDCD